MAGLIVRICVQGVNRRRPAPAPRRRSIGNQTPGNNGGVPGSNADLRTLSSASGPSRTDRKAVVDLVHRYKVTGFMMRESTGCLPASGPSGKRRQAGRPNTTAAYRGTAVWWILSFRLPFAPPIHLFPPAHAKKPDPLETACAFASHFFSLVKCFPHKSYDRGWRITIPSNRSTVVTCGSSRSLPSPRVTKAAKRPSRSNRCRTTR